MALLKVRRGICIGHRDGFRIFVLIDKGVLDIPEGRDANPLAKVEFRVPLQAL